MASEQKPTFEVGQMYDVAALHFYVFVMDGGEVAGRFAIGPATGPINEVFKRNPTLVHLPPDRRGPDSGWQYDRTTGTFREPKVRVDAIPAYPYNPPPDNPYVVAVVVDDVVQFLWAVPANWPENLKAAAISDPMVVSLENTGDHPPVEMGWTYDETGFHPPEVVVEVE